MIDWPNIKQVSQSLIADLSGLGSQAVRWMDEAGGHAWAGSDVMVYLRVSSLSTIGMEEERRDDNGADDQTVTVCAQKRFTLSIRCESFVDDIDSQKFAGSIIETIRQRLARSSTNERIRGVFAIQDDLPTKWFSYKDQARQIGVYVMDLLCLTVDNDVDDSPGAGGWIGEAIITGTLKDTGGDTIATTTEDVSAR